MKSVWDFPSRAAAIEELGVAGFIAAVVREHRSRSGKQPSAVPSDKTGKHSLASNWDRVARLCPSTRSQWTFV